MHAMGTSLEGETADILAVVGELHAIPFEQGRRLAALLPNSRFVPLEGRNHVLLEEEPAWPRFVDEVRRFLADDAAGL